MTQFLPPNLLQLFAPRDPIPYLPPVDKLPYEKKTAGYTGIAAFVNQFEDPKNTPPPLRIETREERQERKRKEKAEQVAYKLEQDIALWSPAANPAATTDPYKTLFVARVNYDTSESKLRREFEIYGHIKKIVIVHDKNTGKPRGYAFIEYERERDMHSLQIWLVPTTLHLDTNIATCLKILRKTLVCMCMVSWFAAYKHADGKKIDGRRVLVDVERGRTVKGWLPRRLGGGLGGTRRGGPEVNVKHSGREEPRLEERYLDRERPERPERRRSRSRSRERRRRSRSRSRERHRAERHKRDRSRDRVRDRETVPGVEKVEANADVVGDAVPEVDARKERRRSRSRDRDRKRRRSRSRDRDRKRRDYDRDRDSRRERGGRDQDERIKEEPVVPPETSQDGFNNTGFDGEYNYNNSNMEPAAYEGY